LYKRKRPLLIERGLTTKKTSKKRKAIRIITQEEKKMSSRLNKFFENSPQAEKTFAEAQPKDFYFKRKYEKKEDEFDQAIRLANSHKNKKEKGFFD
jgi:hypothetical protein